MHMNMCNYYIFMYIYIPFMITNNDQTISWLYIYNVISKYIKHTSKYRIVY